MTSNSIRLILTERIPYVGVSGVVFILDRWSKTLVESHFRVGESLSVITGFFDLTYVRNTGVAFGVFSGSDSPARTVVLSGFALAAALIVIFYSVRTPISSRGLQTALSLILGGSIGNLVDRLSYGYVVDFLEFSIAGHSWPTFNIADSAISIGVALLAVEFVRDEIRSRN